MWICLFLLNPCAYTSNKQVGLEIEQSKSTCDGKLHQFSLSKTPEPAGFGASLVLSTIVLPRNFEPFRQYRGPKR